MAVYGGPPSDQPYAYRPAINYGVIGEAWQLVTAQLGTWIVAMLLWMLVVGGVYFAFMIAAFAVLLPSTMGGGPPSIGANLISQFISFTGSIIANVVNYVVLGGMYRMAIRQLRGEAISASDIFSVTDVFGQLLLAALLVGLSVGIGFLFCFIPGFVMCGLTMFTVPLVVDQRMPAMAAFNLSVNALKSDWGSATLFYFVTALIGGLGVLLCGVGFVVTYPLLFLSVAITYRNFMQGGALPNTMGMPAPYPGGGGFAPVAPLNYPGQQSGVVPPGGYQPAQPGAPPQGNYPPQPGYAPPPGYGQAPGMAPPGGYQTTPTPPNPAPPSTTPPARDLNAYQPPTPPTNEDSSGTNAPPPAS